MFEFLHSSDKTAKDDRTGVIGGIEDFLQSTVYTMVQKPVDGIVQLADHALGEHWKAPDLIDKPKHDNWETKLGEITGSVGEFALVSAGVVAAVGATGIAAEAALPAFAITGLTAATAGAVYSLTQPVSEKGNYWVNKGTEVGLTTVTTGVMGALAGPLSSRFGKTLVGTMEADGVGGVAGGTTRVALEDLIGWKRPTFDQVGTIGKWGLFGAAFGAVDYAEHALGAWWNGSDDSKGKPEDATNGDTKVKAEEKAPEATGQVKPEDALERSIQSSQKLFDTAGNNEAVIPTQKQLYNVSFRKVTAADGEMVPTLENPSPGELVPAGKWVATRLDATGKPVIENGMVNQWAISPEKIVKTYQTTPEQLAAGESLVAPTRVDGPVVHMTQLPAETTIHTKWGAMTGKTGDWLANYDYDAATGTPGKDYAIVSAESFRQTYQPVKLAK